MILHARLILLKIMEYSKVYLPLPSSHQLEPKLVVCCYLVYKSVFSEVDVWGEGLPTSEGMRLVTAQISAGGDVSSLLASLLSKEVCLHLPQYLIIWKSQHNEEWQAADHLKDLRIFSPSQFDSMELFKRTSFPPKLLVYHFHILPIYAIL